MGQNFQIRCFILLTTFIMLEQSNSQTFDKSACPAPDPSQFSMESLVDLPANVTTTEITVTPGGKVFWLELKGQVSGWDPSTGQSFTMANLNTYSQDDTFGPTNKLGTDDGLLGITADYDYAANGWIYIYYSKEGDERKYHLSRFTVADNLLTQEKVLLEVTNVFDQLCHTGGSLAMDNTGNLYLSTGDNSLPQHTSGWAPIDERPGREYVDAQGTAGNSNDLRGKILRIKPIRFADSESPEPGIGTTYEIPAGNMFEELLDVNNQTLPEIYTMGHRNPYRMSVHPRKPGWVAWGEVGPDAGSDDANWGSMGMEEFNLATGPGFFGWPYIIGHLPYNNVTYTGDKTSTTGPAFDPLAIINDSPNNTGLAELPAAHTPLIWNKRNGDVYTDEGQLGNPPGSWGTMAQGGPIYKYSLDNINPGRFPPWYDGQWFIADWQRPEIKSVYINEDGTFEEVNVFSQLTFHKIMDMEFGADGNMYVMSWGQGPYGATGDQGTIARISYTGSHDESCYTVSIKETETVSKMNKGLRPVFINHTIKVPTEMAGIQIYNLRGEQMLNLPTGGKSEIILPAKYRDRVLFVKFLR